MGFMDKAKKFAEQAQQQAKDGTLKERAKALAGQAQGKLDEVQGQFNDKQQAGAGGARPVPPEAVDAVQAAATEAPASPEPPAAADPPRPPSGEPDTVDRSHEAPPKLSGGDPLGG
jgi:uncharacterized membrane protein